MTWHTEPFAVLDLEATGVDPATARIVEVALFVVDQHGNVDPIVDTVLNPGVPMPAEAAAVTGITTADLEARGADPATILNQIVGALDGPDLVALQVAAHRAWRDSFNAYLQKVGAERGPVSGDWPGV